MKTLAKVGVTSHSLWWAINGVNLLFATAKCGTMVRENPYTDIVLFREKFDCVEALEGRGSE